MAARATPATPRTSREARRHPRRVLQLSEARARLSPLLRTLDNVGEVAISVRGNVRGYLIGPRRFEELCARASSGQRKPARRPTLRGTIRIVGDLEAGSRDAVDRLRRAARGART